EQVFGAEAELAVTECAGRRPRDDLDRRKRVVLAELPGEMGDDLTDLDDLFGRARNEGGERLPRFLPEHAQTPVAFHRIMEYAIIRKRGDDFRQRNVECEVMRVDIAFERVADLADAPHALADDAGKPAVQAALPAKCLAALERGGEIKIRNVDSLLHF